MTDPIHRPNGGPWRPGIAFRSTPRAADVGKSPARNEWSLLPLIRQRGFTDVFVNLLVTTLATASVVARAPVITPLAPRPALIQFAPQNSVVFAPLAPQTKSYDYPPLKPVVARIQDVPQNQLALTPPVSVTPFSQPDWQLQFKLRLRPDDTYVNLLGTTLAPVVAAAPFGQYDWSLLKTWPPAYIQWTPQYFTGFIPSVTPVPPPDIGPNHLIWGSFQHLTDCFRGRISRKVCEIIEDVLEPQTALPDTNASVYYQKTREQQLRIQEIALRAELKEQGIVWKKLYLEALIELRNQQSEDEAIMLMLMDL